MWIQGRRQSIRETFQSLENSVSIAQKYLKALRESIDDKVDFVGTGQCTSFEQYTRCCGEIFGLRMAEQVFLEQLKAQDEIDGTQDSVA